MRKSADLRKPEIVNAVLALADTIGPDRVTTGAVASAIGVTQAALFRHFPSKVELWTAVAETIATRLTAAWDEALKGKQSPQERLLSLAMAQLQQIAQTPALPMLLFSRELNVENDELRTTFAGRLAALQLLLVREVSAGQASGLLRRDVAANDAAVLLTSLIQGVAIRWSLGARNFNIEHEGKRLLKVNLQLLSTRRSST